MSSHDNPKKNIDLIYRLGGLGMAGAILHIGAHPDDEDVGLMAYAARKLGVRIVYWSATRGEGGQNRLGPDTQEALGVYRTWETLAARSVDGGEALFGPFYDFGFSKSGQETLTKWGGQKNVVKEIVRAIRLVQPQIVIGRWTGDPASDGHGHHQAVGQATQVAFDAAGDPAQFADLETQGLQAWRPQRLFHSTGGDWQPGEEGFDLGVIRPEFERPGYVRIDSGEFDPIANRTYQEQAWIGFNSHKTQAMGFVPSKDPFFYYYSQSQEQAVVSDGGFHTGLDASLTGLVDNPGDGSTFLRTMLDRVKAKADSALTQYRSADVIQCGTSLLEGVALLDECAASYKDDQNQLALVSYLERKAIDFEESAIRCLGLDLDCLADYAHLTPGQPFRVSARLWNQRSIPIEGAVFSVRAPAGWEVTDQDESGEPRGDTQAETEIQTETTFDIATSVTAELACPYWLLTPRGPYRYAWPDSQASGQPFDRPLVDVECRVSFGEFELTLRSPAILREGFAGGFRELPVVVVPPISLHPQSNREILQVRGSEQTVELPAVAYSNVELFEVEGALRLDVPPGWQVTPKEVLLSLGRSGDSRTVKFEVTIPENMPAGVYSLRYVVDCGGREYDVVLNPVRMGAPGLRGQPDASTCVSEQFITAPAVNEIHLIDTKFVPGLKYGYIAGATNNELAALSRFGLDLDVLDDEEIAYVDLDEFDAIVVGPNAYLSSDALRTNAARFRDYVDAGGTLIVQYQGYSYQRDEYVPYPFKYSQPHDRVTFENAPVTILEPDHFLFHQPNEITAADFDNWVQDRGMYFWGQWDKRYRPYLASSDPGEDPKPGGLLITSYGRGTYIYAAYSFFKQLPAGVGGAFRLLANILAVPAATILARAQMLKQVSLFASMNEDQLQKVATILSERWLEAGEYLCRQGDLGHELYIIVEGEVTILKEVTGKPEQVIYRAGAGEAIGELQVLSGGARAASMRTERSVHLLVIEGAAFRELMHEYPDMSDRVIAMLVDKLSAAGEE